jgi:hypothetical protein
MTVSGQLYAQAALALGHKTAGSHWIGGLKGPTADLDVVTEIKPSLQGI